METSFISKVEFITPWFSQTCIDEYIWKTLPTQFKEEWLNGFSIHLFQCCLYNWKPSISNLQQALMPCFCHLDWKRAINHWPFFSSDRWRDINLYFLLTLSKENFAMVKHDKSSYSLFVHGKRSQNLSYHKEASFSGVKFRIKIKLQFPC